MAYKKYAVLFLAAAAAAVAFLSVGCGANAEKFRMPFVREETLIVGGFQWGEPGDFNPLSGWPSFPIVGNVNLVYENLFGYNMLTGNLDPILGKNYAFSDSSLVVELNENAKWSDGEPLTAADVVYTFYLHKKYPTNLSSHWRFIDTVYAAGNNIRFKMNREFYNPLVMRDIIGATLILPKHRFEKIETEAIAAAETTIPEIILAKIRQNPMSENVVASGPYALHSYSSDFIALERRDDYWGNDALYGGRLPAPRFILHPIYASNDDYNRALTAGTLDLSQTFFANVRDRVTDGGNIGKWSDSFYIPGAITALLVNFGEATKDFTPNPILRSADFRRALGWAIDYERIRQVALGGYVPAIRPGFIVDDGNEKLFFNREDAERYGVLYDPEIARDVLRKAGFTWGRRGELVGANGEAVAAIGIVSPRGWTDWEQAVRIIVENLNAIGVSARADLVRDDEYWRQLSLGHFDLIMYTPRPEQSASLPWSRFDAVLNARDLAPLGVAVWSNQGRFEHERITELLTKIPTLRGDAQTLAYRELNRIFMTELPVIPVMYRPWQFYQFSTRYWENFPTDENPYAPPQLLMTAGGIKGLWGITAVER